MSTLKITKENYNDILENNEIVFFDFWASWCGPCKAFGPIFEKVAEAHPEAIFGKVNTEEEMELSEEFNIRSIPTLMAFRQNIILFSRAGLVPEEALENLLRQVKALDMDKIREEIERKEKNK